MNPLTTNTFEALYSSDENKLPQILYIYCWIISLQSTLNFMISKTLKFKYFFFAQSLNIVILRFS